jgi:hypothetical protein
MRTDSTSSICVLALLRTLLHCAPAYCVVPCPLVPLRRGSVLSTVAMVKIVPPDQENSFIQLQRLP